MMAPMHGATIGTHQYAVRTPPVSPGKAASPHPMNQARIRGPRSRAGLIA